MADHTVSFVVCASELPARLASGFGPEASVALRALAARFTLRCNGGLPRRRGGAHPAGMGSPAPPASGSGGFGIGRHAPVEREYGLLTRTIAEVTGTSAGFLSTRFWGSAPEGMHNHTEQRRELGPAAAFELGQCRRERDQAGSHPRHRCSSVRRFGGRTRRGFSTRSS